MISFRSVRVTPSSTVSARKMKAIELFGSLKFTYILLFLVWVNMQNTPEVAKAGPAATAACILACCGTACANAAAVCEYY